MILRLHYRLEASREKIKSKFPYGEDCLSLKSHRERFQTPAFPAEASGVKRVYQTLVLCLHPLRTT